jgi:hypothetical protein
MKNVLTTRCPQCHTHYSESQSEMGFGVPHLKALHTKQTIVIQFSLYAAPGLENRDYGRGDPLR